MSKASPEALEALHGLLSATLSDALKVAKASGEAPPASLIKEIREFLKDNGVEQNAVPGTGVHRLATDAEHLPFPGEHAH